MNNFSRFISCILQNKEAFEKSIQLQDLSTNHSFISALF